MLSQQLQKLLIRISSSKNIYKKLTIKYSFTSWIFLKKLQKEGYIRYCETSFSKDRKTFINIYLSSSLKASNLKIISSTKFKTFIKNNEILTVRSKGNLGLIIKNNSALSNIFNKNFGEVLLTIK